MQLHGTEESDANKMRAGDTAKAPFRAFVPGRIWLREYGLRYGGMSLQARTSVVKLDNGELLVHSPCPIERELQGQLAELGPVAHIVAPGTYHYLHVSAWSKAYPEAKLWLCPGLPKKRPELPQGQELTDEPPAAWRGQLDQLVIKGNRVIWEVIFFDRVSRTLIVTDSIEYYGDATKSVPLLLKLWWHLFRMWNRPAPAPEYGLGWRDRAAARECFEHALQWDFERIVLSHGDLIEADAHAQAVRAWGPLLKARR